VIKRIPEDQPFILRASVGKRALVFGGLLLFILLIVACPIGLAAGDSGDVGPMLGILGCLLVFIGALLGLQLYLLTSGGPVLAAGPQGIWIKTRPTRGQAIWLPWEMVERVYRRRWALEKMVCVKPRDPRVGGNLGAFTAIDSSMQQLVFGSGLTATLNFADKPEEETMNALRHFAAGRCPVE
jgi:disulfide bond formation protein DsbB